MAAAAANEDDDDDDDDDDAADTYAATSMRASVIEGRRLAERRRDTMTRLASNFISHHYAHIQSYTDTDDS
jgi:hypothetical protein